MLLGCLPLIICTIAIANRILACSTLVLVGQFYMQMIPVCRSLL